MKLHAITEEISVYRYDPESDDDRFDPYVVADMTDKIADDGGIRISRDKQLTFVALDDQDNVLGAVWTHTYQDNDQDAMVYDFDIATLKGAPAASFMQLINNVLDDFRYLKVDEPRAYIRAWVVNPKLAGVLERRYGFEVESYHDGGSCHMTHY